MKFLISAGPTKERIDPVRFISNHSSGKMGYALASAALKMGHEVILVSGPVNIIPPKEANTINIESAAEMADAMKSNFNDADITISCAAVADYRPVITHQSKMKKGDENLVLELERTEDILARLGKMKVENQLLVGFAAETNDLIANAKGKLERKNLDWIVANKIGEAGTGFAADQNEVTLISKNGKMIKLPLEDKSTLAEKIISQILT